ncbi:MAG: hypothetical protein Q8S33_25760 [Myxococcales bacterium]|nr:hypothetical protein [Myxococcales bacterium]
MSTNPILFASLTLLAACRPAFEAVDPALCAGARPTARCGPGCQLSRHELPFLPRALHDRPLDFTREVSATGWAAVSANPDNPPQLSVGPTRPLSIDEVLAAAGEEVLFKTGPVIASLDAATGEVSHVANTTGRFRWAAGPAGGFFVVSGRQVSPSNPRYGARAVVLPSAPPLVAAPARAPFPTDVASGVIFIPTSSGLFAFQPAATSPLTLLAAGTFTSVALLGGDVYASRCQPMPDTPAGHLEATVVIPLTSRCDIVRAPLGSSNAFVTIATLTGTVELQPRGDGILARSPFELTLLTREGGQVLLYALPHPDSTSLNQERVIGPLVGTTAQPAFESGVCVVTLDETRGTTVRDLEDPLELVTGVVRFTARPAP